MAATATEPKTERTIFSVKGTSTGCKVELTKPTRAALAKAQEFARILIDAPGIGTEAKTAADSLYDLLAKAS